MGTYTDEYRNREVGQLARPWTRQSQTTFQAMDNKLLKTNLLLEKLLETFLLTRKTLTSTSSLTTSMRRNG